MFPLPRPGSDSDADSGPGDERAGWELVSSSVAADGLTEQRIYRRPA